MHVTFEHVQTPAQSSSETENCFNALSALQLNPSLATTQEAKPRLSVMGGGDLGEVTPKGVLYHIVYVSKFFVLHQSLF